MSDRACGTTTSDTRALVRRLASFLTLATGLAWIVSLLRGAPAPVVASAVLPTVGWALLALLVARRRGEPALPLAAALLWGAAVAAPLSGLANDALATPPARHADTGLRWDTIILAPLIEETAKGIPPLLLLLGRLRAQPVARDAPLAGTMLGIASGLGFAATENVHYLTLAVFQGGFPGLLQATWVRAVLAGAKHATFTACTGAGAGAARGARSTAGIVAGTTGGLAAAVLLHAAWNGLAAPTLQAVLCDAPAPGAACATVAGPLALLVVAPLVVTAALAPAAVALTWLVHRSRRTSRAGVMP